MTCLIRKGIMIVLNTLEHIFNIIFWISIIISITGWVKRTFLISFREREQDNTSDKMPNKYNWKYNLELIIKLSTIVVIIVVMIQIAKSIKKLYWLLIIGVPIYLELIVDTSQSFGIVGRVVRSRDNSRLSSKEYLAISTLAYILWIFGKFNIFEKIIENACMCSNVYLSDLSVALIYVLAFCTYIFFICALLPKPIVTIINTLKNIHSRLPWKDKIKGFGDYWVSKIGEPIAFKSTLILQWEIIRKRETFICWIRYLLLPLTFVLDIITNFVIILIPFISSSLGYVCVLNRMIKNAWNRLSNWLLGLSDKRIVAISFRVAPIMALVCIVVLNRYQSVFKMQETNTAILEFAASTIIIPIVFEWINSVKNNQFCREEGRKS